jgi:sulfotransferase
MLLHLEPEARLIITIRELGQIYGSIEAQHQKTILVDFIDHLADYDRFGRADQLFAKDKAIGAPLSSIQAVQDLPQSVKDRIFFVKFEDLVSLQAKPCLRFMPGWEYRPIKSTRPN